MGGKMFLIVLLFSLIVLFIYNYEYHVRVLKEQNELYKKNCYLISCVRGKLGNQIWEYMSLYVTWQSFRQYGYKPYIEKGMVDNLEELFENLSISTPEDINITEICINKSDKRTISRSEKLNSYASWFQQNPTCEDIFLEKYSSRYEDIVAYKVERIKEEMRFKKDLVTEAQNKLRKISRQYGMSASVVTFVGMYYRGNDYFTYLRHSYNKETKDLPEHYYYRRAMRYFKRNYKWVIFILITVDIAWLKRNRHYIEAEGHVVVNPYYEREESDKIRDLVLLSHCNHSIINYGTFGATAALFAGGTTFVYDLKLPLDHRGATIAMGMAAMLDSWRSLT